MVELTCLLLSGASLLQGCSQAGLHMPAGERKGSNRGTLGVHAARHALWERFYLPTSIWWQISVGGVPMETKRIFGLSSLLIQFALSSSGLNLNS